MTVTLRLASIPVDEDLSCRILACLPDLPAFQRDRLLSGEPATAHLRVENVAALMALGVHLSFSTENSARSLPVRKEQAVRVARALVAANEHVIVGKNPAVQVDPRGGGFFVDAKIFVNL